MFSKISRYKKLQDVVTIGITGRSDTSKEPRLLPDVTGKFFHTIEERDRLDNLSFKYYRQPKKWWCVCDASTEILSPQGLIGKEPLVVSRFTLTYPDDVTDPPWTTLRRNLMGIVGVEEVAFEEDISLVSEEIVYESTDVTIYAEKYNRAVVIKYNRMNVSIEELTNEITTAGFGVIQPVNISRLGKNLAIPPVIIG
jgi:hypothetical protein